jgi:ABC-type multidrug transport system ATPase subunit
MTESYAVQTQGLSKSYGAVRALQGVDLEVRRGEVSSFLGPNGAGKTTTIRCLLGLSGPTALAKIGQVGNDRLARPADASLPQSW